MHTSSSKLAGGGTDIKTERQKYEWIEREIDRQADIRVEKYARYLDR
jgi:hypothetical protein